MKTRTPLYGLLAIFLILSLSSIFVVAEDKHDGSFFTEKKTEKKEEKKQEHPKVEKQKKGATHDMRHGGKQCQGNTVKTGELTKGKCFAVVVTAAHCINATIGPHSSVVIHPDKTETVFKHTDIDIHLPDGNQTLSKLLTRIPTEELIKFDMAVLVIKSDCNTIKETFPEIIPIIPKEQVSKICMEGAKICVQGRCNPVSSGGWINNLGGSWQMEGNIKEDKKTHFNCQLEKCRAQSGDSGGPVTQEIEGKQTLVGVLSTSSQHRGPRTGKTPWGELPNCTIKFSKGLPQFIEQIFASIEKGTGESSPTLTKPYLERVRDDLATMGVAKNFGYNPYKISAEQAEKDWKAAIHYRNHVGADPSLETRNNIQLRYEQDLKQESLKEEKLEKNRVELESMNVLNLNAETVEGLSDWQIEHYLEVIRQELQRQRDSGNPAPTVHHMTIEEIFRRYVNPRLNERFIAAQPVLEEEKREKKHSR